MPENSDDEVRPDVPADRGTVQLRDWCDEKYRAMGGRNYPVLYAWAQEANAAGLHRATDADFEAAFQEYGRRPA